MKGFVMPNATFTWDDLFIDTPSLREVERLREEILRQQLQANIARARAELFTHWDEYPRTKTVPEKIKEMWERSNYYKMMQSKAVKVAGKTKGKPYYRMFERW